MGLMKTVRFVFPQALMVCSTLSLLECHHASGNPDDCHNSTGDAPVATRLEMYWPIDFRLLTN